MAETTRRRGGEIVRKVFEILLDAPEGLPVREIASRAADEMVLSEYEKADYPNAPGVRRFDKIVRFATITPVKAGWLEKLAGRWRLTDAGRLAYEKYTDPATFLRQAIEGYKAWMAANPRHSAVEEEEQDLAPDDPGSLIERIRAEHCRPARIEFRKSAEARAREFLDRLAGRMTKEQALELGRMLNADLREKERRDRFKPAFQGATMKLLVENLEAFNKWTARLWDRDEERALSALDEIISDPSAFPGAGRSYPTVLMYLRNPHRYAVWLPATKKGIRVLTGFKSGSRAGGRREYVRFCEEVRKLSQGYGLEDAELDIVLTVAGKGDKRARRMPRDTVFGIDASPVRREPTRTGGIAIERASDLGSNSDRVAPEVTTRRSLMAVTVFKDMTYNLSTLVEEIRRGEIALPDIQRPFVWKTTKIRDLFDSMYRGFPVGFLLFWSTGAEAGARRIGVDAKEAAPRLMIVDGQQRLTSLYAVLTGQPIVREDYTEGRVNIGFRPRDALFEVTDAAIRRDPEFITDISILWNGEGRLHAVRTFLRQLEAARGELSLAERDALEEAIDRLHDIHNYPFKVVELDKDVEEEQVADVFVRVNSEGVRLEQADFILTLMSVWWEKGRKALEEFARAAKTAPAGVASPANPFISPSPDQLLRVAAGLGFGRGRLKSVYQVLRGKDLVTGEVSPESREAQFATLRGAQDAVLDLTNWHEFLKSVRRAGYRSHSMISSENNLLFAYLFYLIGLQRYQVDRRRLREVIARWFFMTALTGRYTGSFESQVESDLRQFQEANTADEFVAVLDGIIDTSLTRDYWEIQLPVALETAAAYGPALFGYHASLVLLNSTPLFSRLTMGELLDPSAHAPRSAIERHHLFPAKYLTERRVQTRLRNQIANYAFVEWPDNAAISARPPAEYFPPLFEELNNEEKRTARFWHALPEDWEHMEYAQFLQARRKLIATVVKTAFEKLRTGDVPADDSSDTASRVSNAPPRWTLDELIAANEDGAVEFKASAFFSYKPDIPEKIVTESVIKTVAAFLNADGGTLAIGVSDDRQVLGIGPDLDHRGLDLDKYVNTLTSIFGSSLGAAASARVGIRIEAIDGEQVCIVAATPSHEPVYAKVSKGDNVFFVRINNSTRVLEGPDLVSYIRGKWG